MFKLNLKSFRFCLIRNNYLLLSFILLILVGAISFGEYLNCNKKIPNWINYPDKSWKKISILEAGIDVEKFNYWLENQNPVFGVGYGGQNPTNGGVVLTRGGFVIKTWGDPNFKFQSASLGKTFTRMALQLAIDNGLIKNENDRIFKYWSGEGYLDSHKLMYHGNHRNLTFKHLSDMTGGFPVTNGYFWRKRKKIPKWAIFSGDPEYDNYAHIKPGKRKFYSSGGYWRLSQALTAIWKKDLKEVLDEKIMSRIGISKNDWYWISGEEVKNNFVFYPDIPGYGDYLDKPYRIEGIPVRGGGGWVVMNAYDFARIGLLVATNGIWKGEKLINRIDGNVGVNANTVNGWGHIIYKDAYFSFGKVATTFNDPKKYEMFSWIDGAIK